MPFLGPEPYLPPHLEDFPWKQNVHMWDTDWRWETTRIRLWYGCDPAEADAVRYARESHREHLRVWVWFAEHFHLPEVPQFEMQGRGFDSEDGKQRFGQVACWGIFTLGVRR